MSKYIDVEKLIAEIRKLRSESCISESDDYYEYAKGEIIDIIDSLQQEQSVFSSDLDEAAKQLYPIITEEAKSDEWKIANREYNDMCIKLQDAFRKGAEWMARQ